MIISEEFLKQIKDFGLNSYEAKIWAALLSRGVSTAGELSDIANVPRSRSYDILESLEKKGFIVMKLGKPIKYIAVPPEEVVERVKKSISAKADVAVASLDKLKDSDVLNELNLLHSKGVDLVDPTDITGAVKGRDNIHDQLNLMLKTTEKSLVLVTSADGIVRKMNYLERQFKKAKDRGVTIEVAVPKTKENADVLSRLSAYATIRELAGVDARFCISDGKELLFMLMSDTEVHPTYDVAVWLNTPFFANALMQLFQLAWKEMKPIKN
jgi:sugar-specific transcriptional regulator TrmB